MSVSMSCANNQEWGFLYSFFRLCNRRVPNLVPRTGNGNYKLWLAIAYQLLMKSEPGVAANRSFSSYECAEEEVAICRVRESSFNIEKMES